MLWHSICFFPLNWRRWPASCATDIPLTISDTQGAEGEGWSTRAISARILQLSQGLRIVTEQTASNSFITIQNGSYLGQKRLTRAKRATRGIQQKNMWNTRKKHVKSSNEWSRNVRVGVYIFDSASLATFNTVNIFLTPTEKVGQSHFLVMESDGIWWNLGLSENVVYPEKPNGFADHYPIFKWLAIIGNINPTFSDKPIWWNLICSVRRIATASKLPCSGVCRSLLQLFACGTRQDLRLKTM